MWVYIHMHIEINIRGCLLLPTLAALKHDLPSGEPRCVPLGAALPGVRESV